ncbi:VOC family protein [Verminephrobacter eiseniae]|uniref:VOC family protein n=1 Tax=Verminephrobacter eiseniae TaxID=364317 RepID=UPI0010EECF89|nr:VOC family protein [Verminephrobacter eiseniae]KAB7559686.1 glyoxalase [Verminephrobacter sp. Larva24]MCW5231302.1 glyoxalase [Verminephrobacter eiseniae]MCW5293034.1 glyoxalase [Verminephrobacter eiseniae]MCW8184427.1 glyoxalase [Verminephrobacter eiseniae]MCW8221449.1 glyoxalase [Verminephrobacter eiseniae]
MEHATELQAALHTIHLRSPDPLAMARFYSRAYGMSLDAVAGGYACCGPGRSVQISRGPVKQLGFAQFMLHSDAAWQALRQRVRAPAQAPLPAHCAAGGAGGAGAAVAWRDPDGNLIVFTAPGGGAAPGPDAGLPAAMLQHFALRTPQLPQMLAFYTGQLGLVLSDLVRDPEGRLRACFLRSDPLHHALALFLAPMACFDHLSFEVPDWACMKTWGDHMARLREPIVWGLGRHGPGNDVFFMVRDPDGNLVEISSEIEHCGPGRAVGEWPHEERTLNRWGPAISRS